MNSEERDKLIGSGIQLVLLLVCVLATWSGRDVLRRIGQGLNRAGETAGVITDDLLEDQKNIVKDIFSTSPDSERSRTPEELDTELDRQFDALHQQNAERADRIADIWSN